MDNLALLRLQPFQMKQLKLPLFFLFLTFFFVLSSCVKDVDINLEENIAPLPILESELMTRTLGITDFINTEKFQTSHMVIDTLDMALIRSSFFIDEMKKTSLSLKFTNSLDTEFKMDFEFLNDANELKYTVHVPIASGSVENPMHIETTVNIKEPELKIFKEATKMVFKLSPILVSKPISTNTKGSISFQSKVTFLFEM